MQLRRGGFGGKVEQRQLEGFGVGLRRGRIRHRIEFAGGSVATGQRLAKVPVIGVSERQVSALHLGQGRRRGERLDLRVLRGQRIDRRIEFGGGLGQRLAQVPVIRVGGRRLLGFRSEGRRRRLHSGIDGRWLGLFVDMGKYRSALLGRRRGFEFVLDQLFGFGSEQFHFLQRIAQGAQLGLGLGLGLGLDVSRQHARRLSKGGVRLHFVKRLTRLERQHVDRFGDLVERDGDQQRCVRLRCGEQFVVEGMIGLVGDDLDFIKRIVQRRRRLLGSLRERENRLADQRITEVTEALLGDVEDHVALGGVIFGQALEVVLDAGDGVGQGVQALPVGHRLARQQLFLDIAVAGAQQFGGAFQRDHRQPAAHLGEQFRHAGQMLVVPLRSDELDDRVLRLLQPGTRFLDDQLVNLRDVGGRQVTFLARAVIALPDHSGQRRFDVEQRAGDIHQRRVGRLAVAHGQLMDDVELIEDDLARLAEAEHRQGVGDLFQRSPQAIEFGDAGAVAADEQVEAVLDPHQLLAQGGDHGAHRVAVGTGQARALFVDQLAVRQRVVETVVVLQRADARRLDRRLGDIEEQVLGQLVGGRLVDAIGALLDQPLEFLVDLTQQATDRGAVGHAAVGQAFDQARGNLPERAERSALAQPFEAREHPRHVAEVGRQVLVA